MLWQLFDSFRRFEDLIWTCLNPEVCMHHFELARPKVGSEDEGTELSTRGNELLGK